jgi:hypothetical protein
MLATVRTLNLKDSSKSKKTKRPDGVSTEDRGVTELALPQSWVD